MGLIAVFFCVFLNFSVELLRAPDSETLTTQISVIANIAPRVGRKLVSRTVSSMAAIDQTAGNPWPLGGFR